MKKILLTLFLISLSFSYLRAENPLSPYAKSAGNLITGFDGKTPIAFIIEGGANFNLYSGSTTWNSRLLDSLGIGPNSVVDDVYGSALGFSPHFVFGIDVPFNSDMGFTFRAGWDRKYVRSAIDGEFGTTDNTGNVIVENSWTKKVDYASFSLDFRYNLLEKLSINLGAVVDVVARDKEITHWESLDKPLNQTTFFPQMPSWANGGYYDEDMIRNNPLTCEARTGIEFGIDYKIPVLERWTVVPYARFQYFFTKLMKDETMIPTSTDGNPTYGYDRKASTNNPETNWAYTIDNRKMNTLQVGVALWYNFLKSTK